MAMPGRGGEKDKREGDGLPAGKRKEAMVALRKAQLESIAPVLESLPWRRITAGYARVRDIKDFIDFYEMYAPLLAEHEDILIEARDSGRFKWFDLHASSRGLEVAGIDAHGGRKILLEMRKHYWEDEYSPTPPTFTPL